MKKINLSVSLNCYTDKNSIKWNKVNYSEQLISIEEIINLIKKGYCFCHIFNHNGNILTQKEKTKAILFLLIAYLQMLMIAKLK